MRSKNEIIDVASILFLVSQFNHIQKLFHVGFVFDERKKNVPKVLLEGINYFFGKKIHRGIRNQKLGKVKKF